MLQWDLEAVYWQLNGSSMQSEPLIGLTWASNLQGLSWMLVPEWCDVFSWCQLYMVYSILPSWRSHKLTGDCLLLSSTVFPSRDCRNTQGAVQAFCKGSAGSTSSMTQPRNDSAALEMGNCCTYGENGRCSATDLDYQGEENLFLLLAKCGQNFITNICDSELTCECDPYLVLLSIFRVHTSVNLNFSIWDRSNYPATDYTKQNCS